MNAINYEDKLKQQYLLEINSLENAKGILELQINQLKNKISEIQKKQDSRLYVKNNTDSPIFIGNFKVVDFVTKKSFLENVSEAEAEILYERGDVEDVDRAYFLKNKKDIVSNKEQHRTIPQRPSIKRSILDDVIMGPYEGEPVAVELDIKGVKDIEEKKFPIGKDLDKPIEGVGEADRLVSRSEKGLSISDIMHLDKGDLESKLKSILKEKNPEKETLADKTKTPAKKSAPAKKTNSKREQITKRDVKKTNK